MNQLMTPQQVSAEYGVTVQELAEWRRKKIGPAYYVLGTRIIRYLPDNVDQWFRDPANSRWHDFPAGAFARQQRDELLVQLKEAERDDKRAYARALRDGWSEEELKKLGLDGNNTASRRRRPHRSSPANAGQLRSGNTEPATTEAQKQH